MIWKAICWGIFSAGLLCNCTDSTARLETKSESISYDYLKTHFRQPDGIYGVNCWWWWLNGNVTKEAITRDLEAMKSRNFQGAMIFDAGGHNQRGNKDIPAGPLFGSPEWRELFVFALDEAQRLGLEIGFNIQSGWNMGGPCITTQYAAKQLTYSEQVVKGGEDIQLQLENPEIHKDFYKDIAVLAFPANPDCKAKEKITNLDLKLGFHELGGSAPDCRFLLENGAEINAPDGFGGSPLHAAAACQSQTRVIKLLLKYGANPLQRDCEGLTPLEVAQKYEHPQIVYYLRSLPHAREDSEN